MKKEDVQFKPGVSGNPKGRPKSIRNSTELRHHLGKDMPKILDTLLERAKEGDTTAIKIILDRIYPPLKAQALPVKVNLSGNLSETGGNILEATLTGQIPPDIGAALISALSNQVKILETDEVLRRLEVLENARNN